ncbi:MAG: hypothetical protein ACYDGO_07480 [Smithellaceae bacterium]
MMKNKGCMKISIALCFVLILLFVQPAHAYLDPGSGSAILQGVLAAIVAIGLTVKLFWHKILKFLGIRKDNSLDNKDTDTDKS